MKSQLDICEYKMVFDQVSKSFPFPGYLTLGTYYSVKHLLTELTRITNTLKGLELLDVGCGPMDKTAIFSKMGLICSGVDDLRDPWHALNQNTRTILNFAKSMDINFHHQSSDDYTIPFPENYFDIITSIAVIEHLHDTPRILLNSMGAHLKPGGLLVVEMPNSVNLRKRLSVLFGKTNYNPVSELFYSLGPYRGHVREYTLEETMWICHAAGYEVIHSSTYEPNAYDKLPYGLRHIYILAGALVPTLRSGLLVIAKKPDNWKPVPENPKLYYQSIAGATPLHFP